MQQLSLIFFFFNVPCSIHLFLFFPRMVWGDIPEQMLCENCQTHFAFHVPCSKLLFGEHIGGRYSLLCTVHWIAGRQLEMHCNTALENSSVLEHSETGRRKNLATEWDTKLALTSLLTTKHNITYFLKDIHSNEMLRAGRILTTQGGSFKALKIRKSAGEK